MQIVGARSLHRIWPMWRKKIPVMLLALGVPLQLGLAAGCDEAEPEQRLTEAGAALGEARDEAAAEREDLEDARRQVAEAERVLRDARVALGRAEARVVSAERRLAWRATDVALFRAVQAKVLTAERLEDDVVRVHVDRGIVTLDGHVDDEESARAAIAHATSTPGVQQVRDHLERLEREGS